LSWTLLFRCAFWAAFAFASWFAVLPLPVFPEEAPGDKILHMLAFATLSFLGSFAFPRLRPWIFAVLLSAYGVLIELVQMIPALNRNAELQDWVADSVAVLITLGLIFVARKLPALVRSR
jgi:VanZ family protein